jgi:hypothetical protein
MDDIRRQLRERQAQIAQEIDLIDKLLAILDESEKSPLAAWREEDVRRLIHKLSTDTFGTTGELNAHNTQKTPNSPKGSAPRTKAASNPRPAVVVDTVKRILAYSNRPMTRTELLRELEEHNVKISGYDPAKVLGTTLWRARDTLISLANYGYWLKDRNYALANYFPKGKPEDPYE